MVLCVCACGTCSSSARGSVLGLGPGGTVLPGTGYDDTMIPYIVKTYSVQYVLLLCARTLLESCALTELRTELLLIFTHSPS